jgi:hypothetical protein
MGGWDLPLEMSGEMVDGYLVPHGRFLEQAIAGQKVKLPHNLFNPVDLMHRVRGLHDGQSWSQPLFDPLALLRPLMKLGELNLPTGLAHVSAETLTWDGEETPCFRVEVGVPGEELVSWTWVRRRDDLVLERQIRVDHATRMILRRDRRND